MLDQFDEFVVAVDDGWVFKDAAVGVAQQDGVAAFDRDVFDQVEPGGVHVGLEVAEAGEVVPEQFDQLLFFVVGGDGLAEPELLVDHRPTTSLRRRLVVNRSRSAVLSRRSRSAWASASEAWTRSSRTRRRSHLGCAAPVRSAGAGGPAMVRRRGRRPGPARSPRGGPPSGHHAFPLCD